MRRLITPTAFLFLQSLLTGETALEWRQRVPEDCLFEMSEDFAGVRCTGKHSDYQVGDTFYPSWASDGNLYSPWTDGVTDGVRITSGDGINTGRKADQLTGPWKMVAYMKDFGEQAYFLNLPSKFISEDGRKMRLAYSANFANEDNGLLVEPMKIHPPGGRYGLSLHEMEVIPRQTPPLNPSPERR